MKASIIRIGNSQGIRIPKLLLRQTRLSGEVEIRANHGSIIIGPVRKPRARWKAAFKNIAPRGDNAKL
jgi:antitoxin MazE